ncbi:MAG: U32 family peptidase, partial [Firmicutes bacterium]|nr:U32 family peptidase [Bacillota bacterium]
DRKGERFRILCHDSVYSELLNCVPLYAADKSLPDLDFYTLYFTVESREECGSIFDMVRAKETPDFRRTAGLYSRELL